MNKDNRIIALVPMRANSKGISGKNIKNFVNKPLCYWMINALQRSEFVDEIAVMTNSLEINSIVEKFNFDKVSFYSRSEESSLDTSGTESVLLEFIEKRNPYDGDIIILSQVTTPLIEAGDIDGAIRAYLNSEWDSLITGVKEKRFYWSDDGKPLNYDPLNRSRRQDFEGCFVENGALYISNVGQIKKSECRISGQTGVYEMPFYSKIEMDEPEDWVLGEFLFREYILKSKIEKAGLRKLKEVKLLIMDVDGVLTDTAMFYSEKGDELKRFSCRDGMGIKLLKEKGVKTGIITSENTEMVNRRALKLNIDYLFQGIWNKDEVASYICETEGILLENVAFIGDDVNDIPLLEKAGFAFCPSDAVDKIKNLAGVRILNNKGGNGAVRELCELIIESMSS